mmetsp:Transcript_18498/g.60713  ORF Transcript_18498/g.60713 Transcript_18498/m.60713 type:complete len:518 (+) Transcript_18498:204-1757(+)
MLPQSTAALASGADVAVLGREASLEQPGAEANAKASLAVERLDDEDEAGLSDELHALVVHHVERALVDQTHVHSLRPQTLHRVQAAVQRVTVRHDVSLGSLADHVILAGHERVALSKHLLALLVLDRRQLGASGEDAADAMIPEHSRNHLEQLVVVSWEVEPGGLVLVEPVVRKEVVEAVVAGVVRHVVDAAVREVAEDVGVVEPRHGHLRHAHLEEGSERREDRLLALVHAEPGGGLEVSALHDARLDENVGELLVDHLEPRRALQVRVDAHHFLLPLLWRHRRKDLAHRISKLRAVGPYGRSLSSHVGPGPGVLLGLGGRALEPLDRLLVALLLEVRDGLGDGDGVMPVAGSLHSLHARAHLALGHDGDGPILEYRSSHRLVQRVQVLPVTDSAGHAMALQRLLHVVALEVVLRMSGDRHVVVVDDELDVDVPCCRQPRCLSVVALLLRSVRRQAPHDLVGVRHANSVDHGPHLPKPSRAELDAGGAVKLWMAGETRVTDAVLLEVSKGDMPVER